MDDNMKFISNLIPLGDALAKIDENQKLMDTEKVHIRDSQGRVLAHSISSYHNSPPFDKSAMDGYAVIQRIHLELPIMSLKN